MVFEKNNFVHCNPIGVIFKKKVVRLQSIAYYDKQMLTTKKV